MKNWKKVYSSPNDIRVGMIKTLLQNRGINVIVINKKDTAYNNFGELEIYVHATKVLEVLNIINDELQFE